MQGFHLSLPYPIGLALSYIFKMLHKEKEEFPKWTTCRQPPGAVKRSWGIIMFQNFLGENPAFYNGAFNLGDKMFSGEEGGVIRGRHRPNGINEKSRVSLLGNDAFANLDSSNQTAVYKYFGIQHFCPLGTER